MPHIGMFDSGMGEAASRPFLQGIRLHYGLLKPTGL